MGAALTPAEAILHRTGPNNITVLIEAEGPFDPARAFRGVQMLAERAERFRAPLTRGAFAASCPVDWPQHVCLIEDACATAVQVMDIARRLALPPKRPLWRAALVNPDGPGWSGVVLHFDHAIADGTRIARHIVTHVRPAVDQTASVRSLPTLSMSELAALGDARLSPAPIGLCRLPFAALRKAVPGAISHGDALLRVARRALDTQPEFAAVPTRRKDRVSVAKIAALQSGGRLGNHALMEEIDLSKPSVKGEVALFRPRHTPLVETLRMGAARLAPSPLLRRIVQAEFSRPGIVQTIVPVSRRPLLIFGLSAGAIHPAAPALGRPLIALTATRYGDGFDVSVTAHAPDGAAVADLSERVVAAMLRAVQ
ncbi:hypothetical protein KUL25_06610 [Rhodobacteraceae bacterium N5(2021)]|uniref:Uncharacterized protein n=1 Tax=Gymnodinialimonas phycosphaerae TaxID=2841589 RepID=A0A975TYU9_9RHOB|nr:hypothetical protein [Gymnodinialimonas phycosphaerae]MBY4892431.1 hypothetical protein [Gymnodinialimonas phycosphaerae]